MKKIKIFIGLIALTAMTILNFNVNFSPNKIIQLSLENLSFKTAEAYELDPVVIECSSGSSGKCFVMDTETCWPSEKVRYFCRYTGGTLDNCKGWLVTFCNLIQ